MAPRLRRFTISTDRIGPRRWCWVRIHPDEAHFAAAAKRLAPWHDEPGWWDGCLGCFQPTGWIEHDDGAIEYPRNGFAGTLRLIDGHVTSEIVAHELVHAAVQIYRMNVKRDVRLSRDCGQREEELAYIYGELYGSLMSYTDFP
ncbi:hypothetical protein [Amycolatopsis sp. NPDC059657]|uniref:hypothetical protein n=1 Tax=Amycolatopsis sp. NPDC059657 TaxID=3346899 RepID=UPI00367167BE